MRRGIRSKAGIGLIVHEAGLAAIVDQRHYYALGLLDTALIAFQARAPTVTIQVVSNVGLDFSSHDDQKRAMLCNFLDTDV